jgi:hypothetical protein
MKFELFFVIFNKIAFMLLSYMGTRKKMSLSFEFELNAQTQKSLRMSYSAQNSDSNSAS